MSTLIPPTIATQPPASALRGDLTLEHVHETTDSIATIELTPPHPPREETPEYQQSHHLLVVEKDTPCKICGVRRSTLSATDQNTYGARAMETHHYPIERSLIDAIDWRKVHMDFPAVYSQASLLMWVDSPQNLLVLCDIHHRSMDYGIHHLPTQDWAVQPYLLAGYRVAATAKDAAAALSVDEQIEQQSGIEQQVAAQIEATAPTAKTPRQRSTRTKTKTQTPAKPLQQKKQKVTTAHARARQGAGSHPSHASV